MIKRKRLIELLAIVFVNILLLLPSCSAPAPAPAPYRVQNPQMMHCDGTESNTATVPKFDSVDDICIVWTDVNRSSHDSLSLFVYRGDYELVDIIYELIDIIEDEGEGDLNVKQKSRVIFMDNPEEHGYYQTEFVINGRPVEQIFWSINSTYHMNGEIGCVAREPKIFFEGNVAIDEDEFRITGEGTDYNPEFIIFVDVLGNFNGTEISLGEIRMFHGSHQENNQIEPFRVDSFDGIFQNYELYSETQRVQPGGCDIFIRIYLDE